MSFHLNTKPGKVVLLVLLCILPRSNNPLGLPLEKGQNAQETVERARTIRQAIPDLLRKTYNLGSICSRGIVLKLGAKTINVRNLRLTTDDALMLAPSLYDQTLEDRTEVWCKIAELSKELAESIGRYVTTFEVREFDRYQGDIVLTKQTADVVLGYDPYRKGKRTFWPSMYNPDWEYLKSMRQDSRGRRRLKRKVLSNLGFYWQGGVVPWRFADSKFSAAERTSITESIASWEQKTCLRFPENDNPGNRPHIRFIKGNGCWSYIGKLSSGQDISIGDGCSGRGIVVHEIGHAVGFSHEQSRPDRNRYININFSNVQPGFECNFYAGNWGDFQTEGVPYDYASVMHYAVKDFGENKAIDTVMPTDPSMRLAIGQRNDLSFWDVKLANDWYCSKSCNGFDTLDWSQCQNEGYRNPNNCNECVCPPGFAPPYCESLQSNPPVCGPAVMIADRETRTFSSPGYSSGSSPLNTDCVYMIRTVDARRRIRLRFTGDFGIEEVRDRACKAFVEIRYQNMALAGPRYCGFTAPNDEFVSHGPITIVRFFTLENKTTTGFRLVYSTESCGGCSGETVQSEPACLRTDITRCDVRVGNKVFTNRCFDVEPDDKQYCCDGYIRSGSNCERSSEPPTTTTTTSTTTTTTTTTTPSPRGWGPWSAWSRCSASCGLCGRQTRRRVCLGQPCPGSGFQTRLCGSQICPPSRRARVCFTPRISICYTLVSRPCCAGRTQSGNQCVQ